MKDLTQATEQIRSRSNSTGGTSSPRTTITVVPSSSSRSGAKMTSSASNVPPVHAQLARSLSRLTRFQLYYNTQAIVSLLALLYFGIEGALHAEWVAPDSDHWNVNTQRTGTQICRLTNRCVVDRMLCFVVLAVVM
jgi:hypothetical protein